MNKKFLTVLLILTMVFMLCLTGCSDNKNDMDTPNDCLLYTSQWRYKVYDPKNAVVYDSSWVDSVSKINDYIFDKNSTSGRYTFELSVKDNNGNESKVAQTYLVAFLDDEMPIITGANSAMNQATITLTDTGMGIDEDGITFIEDGRGSGVEAYWVTRDEHAVPTEQDWITLDVYKRQV